MTEKGESAERFPRATQTVPFKRVTVLGVGLLGGSVIRSLARREDVQLSGWLRRPDAKDLLNELPLDRIDSDVESLCSEADAIVVAVPVDKTATLVRRALEAAPSHAVVTDVGSTKAKIIAEVNDGRDLDPRYVPAHPIAGSERSGPQASRADLFDGKLCIVTPQESTTAGSSPRFRDFVVRGESFWELVGCHVRRMTAIDHDKALALVSHVPHLVSSLVAGQTPESLHGLCGSGWRDITRVAAGDVAMWMAIVRHNREAILGAWKELQSTVQDVSRMLENADDDSLEAWLAEAARRRKGE